MDIERSVAFIQFLAIYFGIVLTIMVFIVAPLLIWIGIIPKPKWWK